MISQQKAAWPRRLTGMMTGAAITAMMITPGVAGAAPAVQASAASARAISASVTATSAVRSAVSGTAPGGPGVTSYLDVARKDCFGTARDRTSKVWFTVAGGVLSDVYYPTIESSNVKTVQYIVTDGKTFADLQQRDMTYTVSAVGRSGMVCQVTSTDSRHGFQIVTDYLTDPARTSVVMHSRLVPLPGSGRGLRGLKVYVRYNPHIDNTGGGGSVERRCQRCVHRPGHDGAGGDRYAPRKRPWPVRGDGVWRAGGQPAVPGRVERIRRDPQRRSRPARCQPPPGARVHLGQGRERRADRAGQREAGNAVHGGAGFRVQRPDGDPHSPAQSQGRGSVPCWRGMRAGWRGYDHGLRQPPQRIGGFSATQDAAMRQASTGCPPM